MRTNVDLALGVTLGMLLGIVFTLILCGDAMTPSSGKAIRYLEQHGGRAIDEYCDQYCEEAANAVYEYSDRCGFDIRGLDYNNER